MADRAAGLTLLALATCLCLTAPARAERLPPKDECSAVPALAVFLRGLEDIVARKDAKKLIALVAPDSTNSFGDIDVGPMGFAEAWTLNRPAESAIWAELHDAMTLGCALDGERATLPLLSGRIGEEHPAASARSMMRLIPLSRRGLLSSFALCRMATRRISRRSTGPS